jgi:tetratricopeptide (TPR) repeat protein
LLIERRKQIHEHAGQALESIFTAQLDDHLGQLAHHYSHSENIDKAIEYLGRAGQQAMQRSSYADAISNFSVGIELLAKFPDGPERIQRELLLQLSLSIASIPIKGWASLEVEESATRARELCGRLGDPPEVFPALWGVYSMHLLRAELRKAHELAELLLRLAESANAPALLLYAHGALGFAAYQMGELPLARRQFEALISIYDRERDHPLVLRYSGVDIGVAGFAYLAVTLQFLGYPDQALKRTSEALTLAEELSHPFSLQFAQFFAGIVLQSQGDAPATQESAARLIALSAEHGFTPQLAHATVQSGWSMAKQGRPEAGISEIQKGLSALHATRMDLGHPYFLSMLIGACIEAGRFDDAEHAITEALTLADEHEDRDFEAEIGSKVSCC